MNGKLAVLLGGALCAALGGGFWWWQANMEKRIVARHEVSPAARSNPMLSATLLLRQHQHPVKVSNTLLELTPGALPDGTLILADQGGVLASADAERLLAWVRRGNTLVFQPRQLARGEIALVPAGPDAEPGEEEPDEEDEAASEAVLARATEVDPLGALAGVRSMFAEGTPPDCEAAAGAAPTGAHGKAGMVRHACVRLPGKSYLAVIDAGPFMLATVGDGPPPAWGDTGQVALRVYTEGKGQLVALAGNYFDNHRLGRRDHAEVLLSLAELNGTGGQVTIVQNLTPLRWWRALWDYFRPALISLACFLLVLLWRAGSRFGPLLPDPQHERRSVIEHIDASATWLWQLPEGRDILLEAARRATHAVLARRVPELGRLAQDQQLARLCALCPLPAAELGAALYQPAARLAPEFSRQVRTLSELRKYYER